MLALRREKSKPIILAIQDWALEVEARPQSSLASANPQAYLQTAFAVALRESAIPLPHETV